MKFRIEKSDLVCCINLGVEANLIAIFIGSKSPWFSKVDTFNK